MVVPAAPSRHVVSLTIIAPGSGPGRQFHLRRLGQEPGPVLAATYGPGRTHGRCVNRAWQVQPAITLAPRPTLG
jgi:hypothetical protein